VRTSPNSVRSDFLISFQCHDFQSRQNFAPCFHRLRGEQSRNTQEAQPLGALVEWRVAVAVIQAGRGRKALMTKGLRARSLGGMSNEPWTDEENDLIVADYYSMLVDDLAGKPLRCNRTTRRTLLTVVQA
jgi:hypothetical protein